MKFKVHISKKNSKKFKKSLLKPINLAFITLLALILLTIGLFFTFHKTAKSFITPINDKIVIINHDHITQIVPSIEPTVGALLSKLNIKLNQGDVVEPALNTPIAQDDFRINIYRASPVEVIDGNNINYAFSAAATPRAIAEQQGIKVYAADIVKTAPVENFLSSYAIGKKLIILPAKPVYINLYGTALSIRTQANTVGQLIKQENIKLSSTDQVVPSMTTPLADNSQVFIIRHGTKIESITNQIPMPVQVIDDPSLAYGTGAVRQQGSPGQEVITYQDNLSNGVVTSRTVIQDVITTPPVTQIEVEGTSLSGIKGDMALAGIAPSDYQYADYIISHESGWCPTKAQGEHYCPVVPDNSMTPNGYGLCQATPGYKMASAGADWATNPVTQLSWCNSYAQSRYNGWYNAYIHWINNSNW